MTTKRNRVRETIASACVSLAVAIATFAVLEIMLRIADFRELRETLTEQSLSYGYDPELGWMPVQNSSGRIVTFRTTHYKHNSLGLRDEEFSLNDKPTIMFLGDSFVWGLDSEVDERFTELLKPKLPDYSFSRRGSQGLEPIRNIYC